MNRQAYDAILAAQEAYLLANGWVRDPDGQSMNLWREPDGTRGDGTRRYGRCLAFSHAVNSQLYADRRWRVPPPPETRGEKIDRWLHEVASHFLLRHAPGDTRQRRRQDVRQWIRLIAREGPPPTTRVEKARLARALHAKKHRGVGCECGRPVPW